MSSQSSHRWPALLTRKEAAEYLGIGKTSFSNLLARGVIRGVKHWSGARDPKYKRSDLDDYIESLEYGSGQCPTLKGASDD